MKGSCFVITGPSGVGKSTLLRAVGQVLSLEFSVSATTRPPRPGEVDGKDYHFITKDQFDQDVEAGAFLEHATVFERSYGTYKAPVLDKLHAGMDVVLDLDIQGHRSIRETLPEAVHIFIAPPLNESEPGATVRGRLFDRGHLPFVVDSRMSDYDKIMSARHEYDTVIVNDDLNTATLALLGAMLGEIQGVL